MRLEREIDEAGPGDVDFGNLVVGAQPLGDGFGQFARLFPGVLGKHHCGIGRHVAMGRIARRLDNNARKIRSRTKHGASRSADTLKHVGEQMLGLGRGSTLCAAANVIRQGSQKFVGRRACCRWQLGPSSDCRSTIDRQNLTGGDRRFIGRKIDRHVGHVDRQTEPKQMRRGQLLDVLRALEKLLHALGEHDARRNRIHPDLVGRIFDCH